ncbi:hypothetical protein CJD36_015655 [Flavipsychrobacter stenotrophus]|uniref:Beta family protein n=1 Tax=Flavipsychrobacter stenotrophus TaxID=2077091 RepID=A0A2S7SU38_9BACT|nr:beta family protein [Flavipsychrobacter stenotrophus]PQJ10131.1 hypothetical protein CJD36_015655 [Flavipsychrobacter stenotrophus]
MKKYFPILISKEGELKALTHLSQDVKENICPIIEVLPDMFAEGHIAKKERENEIARGANKPEKKGRKFEDKLVKTLTTHWKFHDNQILLDFAHCSNVDEKKIESNNILAMLNALADKEFNVIPVISYRSSEDYLEVAKKISGGNGKKICIRLSNALGNFDGNISVDSMAQRLNKQKADIILLFDVGFIEQVTYDTYATKTKTLLNSLEDISQWFTVIIASGSFPVDLSTISVREEPHFLTRYEWMLWNDIQNLGLNSDKIKYGDYGIKYPVYSDVAYSGSISIKYTNVDNFVIYRGGVTQEHELGHSQYIMHAIKLVKNVDCYSGEKFCWGDSQIEEYSKKNPKIDLTQPKSKQKPKPGGPGTWVAIGQNHHITLLLSLV